MAGKDAGLVFCRALLDIGQDIILALCADAGPGAFLLERAESRLEPVTATAK